jgi:hypothetical protein
MTHRLLGGMLLALVMGGFSVPAGAARLKIPLPAAGGLTLAVVTVHGKVHHLPKRFDLRKLFHLRKKKSLPSSTAIYAGARLTRSGEDVTLRLGLFVFYPRPSSQVATRVTTTGWPLRGELEAQTTPPDVLGDIVEALFSRSHHLDIESDTDSAILSVTDMQNLFGANAALAKALQSFEDPGGPNVQALGNLGSYDDGHAYGWKVPGSRAGADNAPAVVGDFIAIVNNIESNLTQGDFDAEVSKLETDAGFPAGSLGPGVTVCTTCPCVSGHYDSPPIVLTNPPFGSAGTQTCIDTTVPQLANDCARMPPPAPDSVTATVDLVDAGGTQTQLMTIPSIVGEGTATLFGGTSVAGVFKGTQPVQVCFVVINQVFGSGAGGQMATVAVSVTWGR